MKTFEQAFTTMGTWLDIAVDWSFKYWYLSLFMFSVFWYLFAKYMLVKK